MAIEAAPTVATPAAPVAAPAEASATPAARPVSDIARAQQARRAAQVKVAPAAPAAKPAETPLTREAILAELESDPEAFVALAERVNKRLNPPTPEETLAAVQARVKALDDERTARETAAAEAANAEAKARTDAHVAEIGKLLEATDDKGEPLYPTLATLDPTSVDEDPADTAYNAVVWAWQQESTRPDGTFVPVKWDEQTTKAKFTAAFEGLEAHYAKIRTPRSRSAPAQTPQSDEDPSPTISSTRAVAAPTLKAPKGPMTVEQAIRFHAKQLGIRS
jgi:hypothetical protein